MSMKTSEALRRAKQLVYGGEGGTGNDYFHICYAATSAGVGHIVCPIIMNLLRPHSSLGAWIVDKIGKPLGESQEKMRKLQATRHAWLDHLIAHYEALGD